MWKRLSLTVLALAILALAYSPIAHTQSARLLYGSFSGAAKAVTVTSAGYMNVAVQSASSNPTMASLTLNGAVANPLIISASRAGKLQAQLINTSTNSAAYAEWQITNNDTSTYFGAEGSQSSDPVSLNRGYLLTNSSNTAVVNGLDIFACAATGANCANYPSLRVITHGTALTALRFTVDENGVRLSNTPMNITSGTDDTTTETGGVVQTRYQATITPASGGAANCATSAAGFKAAATTADCVIATIPAGSRIVAVYADVTAGFTCSGTCTGTKVMQMGISAAGVEIFAASRNVATTATYGLADADMGSAMTRAAQIQGAYVPSWSATTTLTARFTSGTGNWGNASATFVNAGSIKFTIITEQAK